jgi:cellulose synthase/poly-beta-1,6-N-acetylglucosamine synthase-like glycosyltransferase
MYRRTALLEALPALQIASQVHHPGDDMVLTHELRAHGWKLSWQSTAVIYTDAERRLSRFLSQMARWRRNPLRTHAKLSSLATTPLDYVRAAVMMAGIIDIPAILLMLREHPVAGAFLACILVGSEMLAAAVTIGAPIGAKDLLAAAALAYITPCTWVWAAFTKKRGTWSNRATR